MSGKNNVVQELEKPLLWNSLFTKALTGEFNSIQDQFCFVLDELIRLTKSKSGYIYLYDEMIDTLTLRVSSGCIITDKSQAHTGQEKCQFKRMDIWKEAIDRKRIITNRDLEKPKKGMESIRFMVVPIIVNNKIVGIVGLANKENDYNSRDSHQIIALITGLWNTAKKHEKEMKLGKAVSSLREKETQLRVILESTTDAIFGMDNNMNCVFCNRSFLEVTGYKHQNELIGKNMHNMIHHSRRDGTPILPTQCRICKAFSAGEEIRISEETLWRADGTSFFAQLFATPWYKDEKIAGAVITLTDITKQGKSKYEIKHSGYYDPLTGLYNRLFFRAEHYRLDIPENLPISIIVGDINGLKLINDTFGHIAGDTLLRKAAIALKRTCKDNHIIARTGGDEFMILLPKTTAEEGEKIISRIKDEFSRENILGIKGSISMGCDAKVSHDQDIAETIKNAENKMYTEKTLNRHIVNESFFNAIIERLHSNPEEREHSKNVSTLSRKIGEAINLPTGEIRKLKEAGFFHDIGKIVLDEYIFKETDLLTEQEIKKFRLHPVIGYRVLNSFDNTINLTEYVLAHHENWDGSGYPKGLKKEEIPVHARIIRIADSFDLLTNKLQSNPLNIGDAIQKIRTQAGTELDPNITEIFVNIMLDR